MRLRALGVIGLAASAGLVQISDAVIRPKDADAPFVSAVPDRAPRTYRATAFERGGRLAAAGLTGWTAIWDRDTDVPLRLWGQGSLVASSVANADAAEAAARAFLAQHLRLLAPGAQVTDFELVSNVLSPKGNVRSVGFQQRVQGVRVIGGTIGFAFQGDRLAMVSSTALPHVSVAIPAHQIATTHAASRAAAWLASDGFSVAAQVSTSSGPTERVVLPMVRPRTNGVPDITYRVAEQIGVESTSGPGRWEVWVDAADGAPIARRSLIHYATGKVLFDVSDRHPNGTRAAKPSIFATHTVNGAAATSSVDGTLMWAGAAAATVATGLTGSYVQVQNASGATSTTTLTLADGGTATWSLAASEQGDAQLTSFIHAGFVKQFAKTRLNPTLAWLDQRLPVIVNEAGTCNAYSTGDDIHFFRSNAQCQNTGRMADVVYHEFGHSLHNNSVIAGVGQFDGAVSEGMSDVLASLITNDHGMGRGFFFSDAPLRDLNPAGSEKKWPDDVTGEVHNDGEIIGGTMWDLRVALEAKLGAAAGYEKTLDIFYAILQRSSDTPSSYAEALLADDNDGVLANGTPNICEINDVFGRHGLADAAVAPAVDTPVRDGFNISVAIPAGAGACPGSGIMSATVDWRVKGDGAVAQVALAASADKFQGAIPAQPEGTVVQYTVVVTTSNGSSFSFPNNVADPMYEFYVGPVEVIRCFDFEAGFDGWTPGVAWQVGQSFGMSGDPKMAYGGTAMMGIDLTGDGAYPANVTTMVESPEIDLAGRTAVRLQYRRWLGVEDGFFDKARVLVNGTPVWSNFASATDPVANGKNHVDKEWRFVDHDLAAQAASGKVKLQFELTSDPGLNLGGWTVDDVCVVALTGAALTCGNGDVDTGETCDDSNRVDGDGCSANCLDESSGEPGGCCSTGTRPAGAFALSAFVLGLALRRRRRRR